VKLATFDAAVGAEADDQVEVDNGAVGVLRNRVEREVAHRVAT